MALVAYDNSDSSDIEDEDENAPVAILTKNNEALSLSNIQQKQTDESDPEIISEADKHEQHLFNLLPRPSSKKPVVIEEDDEFLHKKETAPNIVKPKAKITVPSLSDFKDIEDRPAARPKATNGKKSGLLSMLPQPKNSVTATTKSLIPHILTQNTQKPSTTKRKEPLPSPKTKPKTDKALVTNYSDESDNEDGVQNDFFSIHKTVELPADDVPLDIDEPSVKPSQNHKRPIESYFKQDHVELRPDYSDYPESSAESGSGHEEQGASGVTAAEAAGEANGDIVLDDEAIMKLCGSRAKRRREDIQLVHVDQSEVLAGAREMLLKGLMEDTSSRVSNRKTGNEPTGQQRRKHQITYLAHQAKANEAELQNQWANSRVSRRQTQSKYGF